MATTARHMAQTGKTHSTGTGISVTGIIIGIIGCIIITASSVYTALKMGALPWPTIFTSITSLVLLRAFGHRSLNEANVDGKAGTFVIHCGENAEKLEAGVGLFHDEFHGFE